MHFGHGKQKVPARKLCLRTAVTQKVLIELGDLFKGWVRGNMEFLVPEFPIHFIVYCP
jgi:hypothetical protein